MKLVTRAMVLFGVCLVIVTASGCDRLRSVDAIAARGEAQYAQGNFRAALADFKTALERDGDNLKAREGLARVSYHLADFEAAQNAVDAALTKDDAAADLVPLKYQVLLARQQYPAMQAALATEKRLDDADRLMYQGLAEFGLGKPEAAAENFNQALSLNPDDVGVLVARARLAAAQGDVASATKDVEAALAKSPDNAEAWFLKGALLLAKSDLQNADQALQRAEQLGKTQLNWYEQARLYGLLTDLSLRQRKQADAARWLNALNQRSPRSALTLYLKARLALLQNNVNDALEHLQKASQAGSYLPARLLLANVLLTKASYGQAEEQLNGLRRDYPDNVEVRKLLAQLYLATQRAAEAERVLPTSSESESDSQLDWLRGQAMLATGARDAGVALLEKSVTASPGDVARSLQLARTYIAAGERDKALALLNSLPADAGAQRQGLMVVASVMGKPLLEARHELDALLARNPKDPLLYAAAGAALAQMGDTEHATELLNQAIKLDANSVDARIWLATLQARAGQFAEAETQLHTVLKKDGKRLQARMLLASIAMTKGDKAQAVKELEQAAGMDATSVDPRLQLAQLAFADNQTARGHALLDQAVTASNNAPAVIDAAGNLLFQAKQYEDALARYEQAIAAGHLASRLNAARVHLALDQQTEARQKLELASAEPQTQLDAVTMLAELDARAGQVERAVKRIDDLPKTAVSGAALDELRGDMYAHAKQFETATKYYDSASKQATSQRLAVKGFQARAQGKLPNATAPLTIWLARQPDDTVILQLLAAQSLITGDNEAAARYFERLLAALPKRYPAVLNDLAWTYQLLKDKRAEATAKEAYEAEPGNAAIADTYGWILLQIGKVSEALPILEKAAVRKKDDLEIQYHLAAAQARSGQKEAARSTLQQLLAGKKPFASRSEAENLLTSLAK